MTIVLHEFAPHIDGDANENCMSKAGPIQVYLDPFFSSDCAIEVGYQVADIGACVLLDRT